ncbi:MAG: type II secretion system protein GspD [Candidatus Dadabacteria bacterium]|nr:MAG: type II secretion system protein GspD [Candidatus Dadabacteria bacterium]
MTTREVRRRLMSAGGVVAVCAVWLLCALAPAAVGEEAAATGEHEKEAILLNFEGADIREVIYTFGAALGINYWVDPRVQGQVTARSFGPIYVDDLLPVFHQILRSNGFAAIKQGDLYMIVPAEEGKTRAPLGLAEGKGAKERFVVDLVRVQHVDAEKIVELLNPFVSPGGDVTAIARSNLVVISDLQSNAARLRELVETFDADTFAEMEGKVYHVEHASVEDVAQELTTILESYQVTETGARAHIIPLARLNSIAVIAFDPAVIASVERWLKILDTETAAGAERRVFVYKVENSKAEDLAKVLNDVYSGLAEEAEARGRGRTGALAERGVGLAGGLERAQRGRGTHQGAQQEARRPPQLVLRGRAGEGVAGAVFEQEVKIVADETTNSLVILATPRDYEAIRHVLRELDIVPRQVLVEMLIAEISLTDNESRGITHTFGGGSVGGTNSDSGSGTNAATGALGSLLFGNPASESFRLSGEVGTNGINDLRLRWFGGDYIATLRALSKRNKVKILSRPHILTTDNQEARILVGKEVPIITSQADTDVTGPGGQTRFLQNVQYRDTGVVVHVTPQVNSEGLVNMTISQEVSEIDTSTQLEGIVSPTFSTREAETTVVVQSGETIVIGGIIRETNRKTESGVPLLMDVPVIGQFFRSTSNDKDRTELIVLITPYVVRNREEARSVTAEFRARVDDVLRELHIEETSTGAGGVHTLVLEQPYEQ